MTETVRLRVFFEEASSILSRSKKKEGLERCWVLLKPHIQTVSDFASHLLHYFSLFRTCPNGIILSMDGFVLPPSESTCIFKDKDIVCVKRKGSEKLALDARPLRNFLLRDSPPLIEDLDSDMEAIEEPPEFLNKVVFQEEIDGYEDEEEEEKEKEKEKEDEGHEDGIDQAEEDVATKKKRKASKKLLGPKKKRSKLTTTEGCELTADVLKGKRKRSSQPQTNGQEHLDISCTHAETKKLPSRSARRKKAKRQWLREQVKRAKENQIQSGIPEIKEHQPPENADNKTSDADQGQIEENDTDDDAVPILVKPGHIRFEPLGKDEGQVGQQNHSPVLQGPLHWNGITSKKKGQKWGIEKNSSNKRTNFKSSYFQPPEISCDEAISCDEEETPQDVAIDFDKLSPCRSFPKEGYVIAYCLLELSESWTPEPSSFRVGKVLISDPVSNRIKLAQLPEYPFEFKKTMNDDEQASSFQPDESPYNEDGTLEIDYSSLLDVRMVKQGNVDSPKSDTDDEHPTGSIEGSRENGERNVWEEINQALSAKKAQLSQDNGWKTGDSSCKVSWSYKGLRRGALGPTIAYLRDQKGL